MFSVSAVDANVEFLEEKYHKKISTSWGIGLILKFLKKEKGLFFKLAMDSSILFYQTLISYKSPLRNVIRMYIVVD